jgi:Zn-finger nucleic acid-binding protein
MDCPRCSAPIEQVDIKSVKVDRCTGCGGTWYDVDELRLLKDTESHGNYRWIDMELWRAREEFRPDTQDGLSCPRDGQTMTTAHYGKSDVQIDICGTCRGIWLDKGEYRKVLAYLDEQVNEQPISDYLRSLKDEFLEIFTGPEGSRSEFADFTKVLSLLQLRFAVQHPDLAAAIQSAAKGTPGVS